MQASSRPEAVRLSERGAEPGTAGWSPPHTNAGVGVGFPLSIWGSQHGGVPASGRGTSARHNLHANTAWPLSGLIWHQQEGHACLWTQHYAFLYFFSFTLNTDILQFYSLILAYLVSCDFHRITCDTIHSRKMPKNKSAKFAGSLATSATWSQLQRRWLTPLSPCLDARELTRLLRNSKSCVKQSFIKIKIPGTLHILICNSHQWLFS